MRGGGEGSGEANARESACRTSSSSSSSNASSMASPMSSSFISIVSVCFSNSIMIFCICGMFIRLAARLKKLGGKEPRAAV